MAEMRQRLVISTIIPSLFLFSSFALAQEEPSECVATGAMAFENWTKEDSGGTGDLPDGVESKDYIRCKACHGWDRRGTDGGYVERSRKDTRPNAGDGDGDSTSRAIVTGTVTADQIAHAGSGRTYAQGKGSWVALADPASAVNTAAHQEGYTLGNQHPDFSGGPMTQDQVDCLMEFLNFENGDPSVYFSAINPSVKPVLYTIVSTADAAAGETFYADNCAGCHGDPAQDSSPIPLPDGGGVLSYLDGDGKYSELAHKTRWGIPDTSMTRDAIGSPSAADIANLLLWLQEVGEDGFAMNPGLTGTWWNGLARDGEGVLLEVGKSLGVPTIFAAMYTYDSMGNQAWLVMQGTVMGDMADVLVWITDGPVWGDNYNPADYNRMDWGSGTFMFTSCGLGAMSLMPNEAMLAAGYSDLAYDLNREDLLERGIACPTPTRD